MANEPDSKEFVQKSLADRIADYCVANCKILFTIASVITLLLASGILRTSFDTSLDALLTRSDPYLDELELLNDEFPTQMDVYFAFVAEEGSHVFEPVILEAIATRQWLTAYLPPTCYPLTPS